VVRNIVTSVDPYQLRMLRGSPEVTPVAVGEPVPANLLCLWRQPLRPGEWRTLDLFAADDSAQVEEVLAVRLDQRADHAAHPAPR